MTRQGLCPSPILRFAALLCVTSVDASHAQTSEHLPFSVSSVSAVQYPINMSGSVVMSAINDSGQVAGYGETCPSSNCFQAFIGTATGSTAIPLTNGFYRTWAYAINNSGHVAGFGNVYPNGLPNGEIFIGSTSGSTVVPLPAGWSSLGGGVALAINDSGQVAGYGPNGD
jgi:hypothetical protein